MVVYCVFFSIFVVICCFSFHEKKEDGITDSLTKNVVWTGKKASLSECLWVLLEDNEENI